MRILAVWVVLACTPAAADPPGRTRALDKECAAARRARPVATTGQLTFKTSMRSEPIRSVAIERTLSCGYRNGKLSRAIESIDVHLVTPERGTIQFDTRNPGQTKRYFVECVGAIRAGLADLHKGFAATWPRTFTLPCVHRIYRRDGREPDRVTGIHSFRVLRATLGVLDAGSAGVTIDLDATVGNRFETLRLQARGTGKVATTVQVFDCEPPKPGTRPVVPPPCS